MNCCRIVIKKRSNFFNFTNRTTESIRSPQDQYHLLSWSQCSKSVPTKNRKVNFSGAKEMITYLSFHVCQQWSDEIQQNLLSLPSASSALYLPHLWSSVLLVWPLFSQSSCFGLYWNTLITSITFTTILEMKSSLMMPIQWKKKPLETEQHSSHCIF